MCLSFQSGPVPHETTVPCIISLIYAHNTNVRANLKAHTSPAVIDQKKLELFKLVIQA